LKHFEYVETVGYAYGQRHSIELECRDILRDKIGKVFAQCGRIGEDHTIDLASLGALSETSLTRETEIIMSENGLPSTFVPGRNLIF
ncbi:7-cyano-7-deazaguanine synthase, partial [Escherichia coli]|nr:7-cyano-7-deazaguanine synthase [Escherichia coli]